MAEIFSNISKLFNQEFCIDLEYHLCRTFKNTSEPDLKGFWCDGISWNPTSFDETNKVIETKAWIGKSGQDEYEMTIQFGKESLECILKEISLIECIPSDESLNWMNIDTEKRTILIQLK